MSNDASWRHDNIMKDSHCWQWRNAVEWLRYRLNDIVSNMPQHRDELDTWWAIIYSTLLARHSSPMQRDMMAMWINGGDDAIRCTISIKKLNESNFTSRLLIAIRRSMSLIIKNKYAQCIIFRLPPYWWSSRRMLKSSAVISMPITLINFLDFIEMLLK